MNQWYLPGVRSLLEPNAGAAAPNPSPNAIFSAPYVPSEPPARRKRKPKQEEVVFPVHFPVHPLGQLVIPDDQKQLMPAEIKTLRYATGIDDRNFITVYEYQIADQSIIWDYYTGYVHLTGIWKALGNSKADIVKLLDGSPELEQVFKRVRGGFLKIQGTWVPFEVARSLSARFSWPIRYALVPIFGPEFPFSCLQPHERGYGQLQIRAKPRARTLSGGTTQPHPRTPYSRERARTNSTPHSTPRRRLWELESGAGGGGAGDCAIDCAIDSSDEEDESPASPPPMPRKLSFVDAQSVLASPPQLLEMLQATRSLQQLSSGEHWRSVGGNFEVEGSGKRYSWDGENKLDVA